MKEQENQTEKKTTEQEKKMYEDIVGILRKSMQGLGTNEKSIIEITMKFTKAQRQKIKLTYKTCFGRDLIKDFHSDTSGNFRNTLEGLYDDPIEYDAKCLYTAIKGAGTDDDCLVEILCSRPSWIIKLIITKFYELYNEDLIKWVQGDTSGHYRLFLTSILQCNRSDNPIPNENDCKANAEELYKAGEAKFGTDKDIFNKIFSIRSPAELCCINNWYMKLYGHNLMTAVDKEFSGNLKECFRTILSSILCPSNYFAEKIYRAIKGLGTNNKVLIRVLISREEIDLPKIMEQYIQITGRNMIDDIKGDTSGDYKKILVSICEKHLDV